MNAVLFNLIKLILMMKMVTMCLVIVIVSLVVSTMADQCPAGRTDNVFQKLRYHDTNLNDPGYIYMRDVEYDFEANEYYLIGNTSDYYSQHFISRHNHTGDVIWAKSAGEFVRYTLEYSPTNQNLYYIHDFNPSVLTKVNSSNGEFQHSLQILRSRNSWTAGCSLSNDEAALFCFIRIYDNSKYAILRLETNSMRLVITNLNSSIGDIKSVLAINSNEVLYSYSSIDLVKANYVYSNESNYSLNEEYYKSYSSYNSSSTAISKFGENDETIWHATSSDSSIFFQVNATNLSLIGSIHTFSMKSFAQVAMDVADGTVCILLSSNDENSILIMVDEENPDAIQLYDVNTPDEYFIKLLFNSEYIYMIGCSEIAYYSSYCESHYKFHIHFGSDGLPLFSKSSSYFVNRITPILTNKTLANYSMTVLNSTSNTGSNSEYSIARLDNESFVYSLPDKLNQSLNVSPGQVLTFDLPCKLDDFSPELRACNMYDIRTPSWITVDCDNFQIQIQNLTRSGILYGSFEIKSSYNEGQITNYFSITLFSCDYQNCESCSNGICDNCSTGYTWRNTTWSCELASEVNSTRDAQTSNTSEGPKCSKYGPTYDTTISTVVAQVFAGIGICVGVTIAFLTGTSAQNVWTLIHYLQLILILPLVAISISEKVRGFIVANAFTALSIYPLSLCGAKSIPLIKHLSFDQPDEYLRILGWSSGSTIVNNIVILMILLVLAVTHFIFCLLNRSTKNKDSKCSSFVSKVCNVFKFSAYIRAFITIYFFTAVMIVSEINYYIKNRGEDKFGHNQEGDNNKVKGNYVSLVFSCILLILLLMFLLLTLISWVRNKNKKEIHESCKARELYYGIRQVSNTCLSQTQEKEDKTNYQRNQRIEAYRQQNENNEDDKDDDAEDASQAPDVSLKVKLARLYYVIFLSRRLVLTLFAVLIPNSLFALKIVFVLPLQIAYLAYAILVRSFATVKDRVVEICNEIVMLVLIIFLIRHRSKSEWTSTAESEFIGIVLFQICILSIVSMISSIIESIKFVKSRRKSASTKLESKEVCREACQNVEISYSMDDQPSRNLPVIPHGSNMFVVKAGVYQEEFEEDKKEGNQSNINFMM